MTIAIEPLTSHESLLACERLQRKTASEGREVLPAALLVAVGRSGGILLGAYDGDGESPPLCGCLIDLVSRYENSPARLTLVHTVAKEARNRGIGYLLRAKEREACRSEGAKVVTWTIDALRSAEAHFAFNKLGAIAVAYERNLFGERGEPGSHGLARDRLAVEWWIDSPRVSAILDHGELPPHFRLGLDRMDVATRTALAESGLRRLIGLKEDLRSDLVLVEVPTDLDAMWGLDPALARDWRLKTRECFERLFAAGYIACGFVHEAGRSFHLLERVPRDVFRKRAA